MQMSNQGSGASGSFGSSSQDGSGYGYYYDFWSRPVSMEGVEPVGSVDYVQPEAQQFPMSPPNSQHEESAPFVGPQQFPLFSVTPDGSVLRGNDLRPARGTEQAPADGDKPVDPTLSMVHNLLSRVLTNQAAPNHEGNPSQSTQPNFLKHVMIMKNLGTIRFEGGADTYKADAWMEHVEKNFKATRCPKEFQKDVAVYYLEGDALSWWKSLNRKYESVDMDWDMFKQEFQRKYFPSEARDRMEPT